ncbi:zinc finger, CCHC-type containing protein [Tanacetum coccineum]|uniref:Zinc finger, CCHC-type containing protein n=1 Tax=Tanacetum coccineum TaxID=301880 RepID=A0ABQ4XH00_9ASTR
MDGGGLGWRTGEQVNRSTTVGSWVVEGIKCGLWGGTGGSRDRGVMWGGNRGLLWKQVAQRDNGRLCLQRFNPQRNHQRNDGFLFKVHDNDKHKRQQFSINSIIESKDAIFKENRFASALRPSLRILNRTEDISGSVVPEEVPEEVLADLPPGYKPLGCKWIFKRKLKVDGTIEKFKASTIRLWIDMASIHNLIIHQMDVKTTFLNGDLDEEVDLTKEFLSLRFSMKDIGEADVILGILVTLVLSTVLEGYADASWISNTEDNSSISGWVFLLGGGAICWASKKQTCITGSTMESEFVALAAVCKEAEWLKNLLLEIPLWSKHIAPISIRCDSAATLAKAYSQIYNGKSRNLGVRHSMIHELITNGMVSIEFVRSQQNLADHLTKGLARDSVIKSAEGM